MLRLEEDVVPEPGLEMALELGKVEVRARPTLEEPVGVVKEEEAEVEQAARDGGPVEDMLVGRCQPRGRTSRVATSSFRRYSRPSGAVNSIVRSIASIRFAWPPTTFIQVGEFASSKSAMKPRAPEFRALMTIFRSTGPVISTRRSRRSCGGGSTCQSRSRTSRVSGRKSSVPPRSSSAWRAERRSRSSRRR